MTKGIIYYTDSILDDKIAVPCRKQILKANLPIVSTSLKPLDFGKNIVLNLERGWEAYFRQILTALENSESDIIFFCEHDWLYHTSHFDFTPPLKDVYYYNDNWWRVCYSDGLAVNYETHLVPAICAYKEILLEHYRKTVEVLEKNNFNSELVYSIGFEPGTHTRKEKVVSYKSEGWMSEFPIIDIRHMTNATRSKWKQSDFRSQRNCKNWKETDYIEGWGLVKNNFDAILENV
jgi:hypothetical protein